MKKERFNILMLNNEFPPIGGGGSILTSYVAKQLAAEGHTIKLITSTYQGLPLKEEVNGYTVIRTPSLRQDANFSTYPELISYGISSLRAAKKLLKNTDFKPDFIQAFFSVPAGATAYMLSKMYGIPYAIYLGGSDVPGANPGKHGLIYPFITPVINHILKNASLVTACSDLLIDMVHKQLPKQKVEKIANGVDTNFFVPPVKQPSSTIRILGVGRIMPRKGFQFLVDAVGLLPKEKQKKLKITIIGSGEYRKELKDNAIKHDILKIVEFIDAVPYKELKKYYQAADIFCLPSLAEGMPLAMLEAMACGCALITTDVAGNQELVSKDKNARNGFLVKPGSSKELAKKLEYIVDHEKDLPKMKKASREMSLQYDWKKITQKYVQLYSTIIKS